MASDVHVYLVPGFFGFDQIGSLSYFQRVTDVLDRALKSKGVDATLFEVATQPTSSCTESRVSLPNPSQRVHFLRRRGCPLQSGQKKTV